MFTEYLLSTRYDRSTFQDVWPLTVFTTLLGRWYDCSYFQEEKLKFTEMKTCALGHKANTRVSQVTPICLNLNPDFFPEH